MTIGIQLTHIGIETFSTITNAPFAIRSACITATSTNNTPATIENALWFTTTSVSSSCSVHLADPAALRDFQSSTRQKILVHQNFRFGFPYQVIVHPNRLRRSRSFHSSRPERLRRPGSFQGRCTERF